jgi:hypothetical protein
VRKRIFFVGCNDEAFFWMQTIERKENESTAIKRFTDERQNSVSQISDSQFQKILGYLKKQTRISFFVFKTFYVVLIFAQKFSTSFPT